MSHQIGSIHFRIPILAAISILLSINALEAFGEGPAKISSALSPEAALAEFQQLQNDGPWEVRLNPQTGRPGSLRGARTEVLGASPVAAAEQFTERYGGLFGIRQADELELTSEHESPFGHHLRYRQVYHGVLVEGCRYTVHLDKDLRMMMVSSSFDPSVAADLTPVISLDDGVSKAISAAGPDIELRQDPDISQAIYYGKRGYRLAYQVVLDIMSPKRDVVRISVDAQTGEIVDTRSLLRYQTDGTGSVFDPSPVVALMDNTLEDQNDSADAVPQEAYSDVTLLELNTPALGPFKLEGPHVAIRELGNPVTTLPEETDPDFIYDREDARFEAVMVYFHIDRVQRFIQEIGFNNVNNRPIAVDPHGVDGEDNSFYAGFPSGLGWIEFGPGGVDDAEDAEVIIHEYGHSIQDNQVPGFGQSAESGALGEGFGDLLAAIYLTAFSGGFQDACVADWDATAFGFDDPPCLRRVDGTKVYPDDLVGQVHADGEIWSGAIWEIFQQLGGDDQARRTVLSDHFGAHFFIQPNASFFEMGLAFLDADESLFEGANTLVIDQVLTDRGILQPILPINYQDGREIPFGFEDVSASGTRANIPTGGAGDDEGDIIPIGFSFEFNGTEFFSQVGVSSNGYLSFTDRLGDLFAWENSPMPSLGFPNRTLAPFWDDLVPERAGSGVFFQTLGNAPSRRFVVMWDDMALFDNPSAQLTFEVILYEETGDIQFNYLSMSGAGSDGSSATVGVENENGTGGVQFGFDEPGLIQDGMSILFEPGQGADGGEGEGEGEIDGEIEVEGEGDFPEGFEGEVEAEAEGEQEGGVEGEIEGEVEAELQGEDEGEGGEGEGEGEGGEGEGDNRGKDNGPVTVNYGPQAAAGISVPSLGQIRNFRDATLVNTRAGGILSALYYSRQTENQIETSLRSEATASVIRAVVYRPVITLLAGNREGVSILFLLTALVAGSLARSPRLLHIAKERHEE